MKKTLLSIALAVCLAIGSLIAQTEESGGFEGTLKNLAGDAGKGFVQPVVSAFGTNLNGGWFHKAPKSKIFGIDLELGLVAMATFTTDENKKFNVTGNFKFSGGPVGSGSEAEQLASSISNYNNPLFPKQAAIDAIAAQQFSVGIQGPTVVGSKTDTLKIIIPQNNIVVNGQSYTIPGQTSVISAVTGVLDGSAIIPLAAPQLSIGTIYGTQATFRYLPEMEISPDLGKFKYFGFGIQHNLGMWLPIPVVDVAASFFTQSMNVGTIMEAKSTSYGLNVAKQFGFAFLNVTPYAGFMLESSTMTFGYDFPTYTDPNNPANNKVERISFELEGEGSSRITVGLGIRLGIININADYNIGNQNSATAGLFFAF